jgi:hypothetical protein
MEVGEAKSLFKKLGTRKTPDTHTMRKKWAKKRGKHTGLGVCQFLATLFVANEIVPEKDKLTDEEIKRQILREFPEKIKQLGPLGSVGDRTVGSWRTDFNKGKFTTGQRPERVSYRYNMDGKRVNGRTGAKVLRPDEVAEIERGLDEWWKKEMKRRGEV